MNSPFVTISQTQQWLMQRWTSSITYLIRISFNVQNPYCMMTCFIRQHLQSSYKSHSHLELQITQELEVKKQENFWTWRFREQVESVWSQPFESNWQILRTTEAIRTLHQTCVERMKLSDRNDYQLSNRNLRQKKTGMFDTR